MYQGPVRVELLFMPGCQCARPALRLLRQVLMQEGRSAQVRIRVITSVEQAARHHFHGSPTILIDGVDIEGPQATRQECALKCRSYQRHRPDCPGVPEADLIRSAIHTHPGLRRPSGPSR